MESSPSVATPPSSRPDPALAVVSIVFGLVCILGLSPLVQIPAGVGGLVLGVRALRSSRRGLAICGLTLSGLGLVPMLWLLPHAWNAVASVM
jgi:hypothetical protein